MKIKNLGRRRGVKTMAGEKPVCKTCQRKIEVSKGQPVPKCICCGGKLCRLDVKRCNSCDGACCEDDLRTCERCKTRNCKQHCHAVMGRKEDGTRVFLCDIHWEVLMNGS